MIDQTPRYAPSKVIIARVMRLMPVTKYVAHPAGTHPASPIKNDIVALECVTEK